jgi:DNA primase
VYAAYHGEKLEEESITTILRRVGAIDLLSTRGRANRLAFSRKHGDAQIERAHRDLGEMIDVMVKRSELDAQIAQTTAGFGQTMDDAGWEEQQHLLRERQATERRLSELREQAEF